MIRTMTNTLIQALPAQFRRQLGFKLLRDTSGDMRAFTELFVHPYAAWVDWQSGIGAGAHVLYAMVRALSPKVVVEIGSSRGRSTCALALGCRHNDKGKVYAIDPHNLNSWTDIGTEDGTLAFLKARLASYELESWCEIIRSDSLTAAKRWSQPIDLLFIDGDHTFEGVRNDFESFQPWLTERSLVLFHDSAWEHYRHHPGYRQDMGVPRYLHALQQKGYGSITIPACPGLTLMCADPAGFPFMAARDLALAGAVR